MRLTDFDVYRDILREKSGILIAPDKTSLLDSRLSPVAKRWGYASVELMTLSLKAVPEKQLVEDVVEALDHAVDVQRPENGDCTVVSNDDDAVAPRSNKGVIDGWH